MRKRIACLTVWLLILVWCGGMLSVSAAPEQRVFDKAQLLTEEQVTKLEGKISALRENLPLDLVVVTTEDTAGKSSRQYADDTYDDGGFGIGADKSGVLLLIDLDNRQAYLSTTGDGIRYLTDVRIDRMLDHITAKLKRQDYAGAVETFLQDVETYVAAGIPNGQYNYDEETGQTTDPAVTPEKQGITLNKVLIFLGISIGAGAICTLSVAAKYKWGYDKNTYPMQEKSNMRMKNSQDIFVRSYITSRRIPQDNNSSSGGGHSSGGSSTHHSSGGTTHGGGGRGF